MADKKNAVPAIALIVVATVIAATFWPQRKTPDPFGLGPIPKVELSESLTESIRRVRDHQLAYVTNTLSRSIYVVDLDDGSLLGTVLLGGDSIIGPGGIDITPDGGLLYVTRGKFCNDVLVINITSFGIVKQIPVGKYTGFVKINADGTEAYVLGSHYEDTNVYVIDLRTNEVAHEIELDDQPYCAALSPDGGILYVTTDRGVVYIDTETHEVTRIIEMDTECIKRIAVHPDGGKIYVTYHRDEEGHWPSVQVFDAATGDQVDIIENLTRRAFPEGTISCIAVSPDGAFIYATDASGRLLSVVDASTNEVQSRTDMNLSEYTDFDPGEIFFSPDGSLACLVYYGAIPIDAPGKQSPSLIAVIDARTHDMVGVITLDEWAGACWMVFAP